MKCLISEMDRNILMNSNFLKATPELGEIYKLLTNSKHLEDSDVDNQALRMKIKRQVSEWVHASLGEWKVENTKSPHLVSEAEKREAKFRCAFCNSKLTRTVMFLYNESNNREIILGSDCAKKVDSPEFMISEHIAKNSVQLGRLEHLETIYTQLEDCIKRGQARNKGLEFITSKRLDDAFDKNFETLERAVKRYLKTGFFIGTAKKIPTYIVKFKHIVDRVDQFEKNAKLEPQLYLSKYTVMDENRINPDGIITIISEVKENGGKISTEVASQLFNFNFLETVGIKYQRNTLLSKYRVSATNDGEFLIVLSLKNMIYDFNVGSKYLIKQIGYPIISGETADIGTKIREHLIPSNETSQRFLIDFERNILPRNNYREYIVTSQKVWKNSVNKYKTDWLQENYGNRLFYKTPDDGKIVEFNRNNVVQMMLNYKMDMVCDLNSSELIKVTDSAFKNEDELSQNIRTSFDSEQMF
ncbi:hypothetical protein AYR62_01095 [Secundilactobacillus paracollinoides]|uniref:hypothetical protein n=1 Tax=Secundilactobacillus paracollinoides TaxID=240427 RepID=UPI00081AA617|nr:hypothetical protein [Secundilactobacillus paracollinoides]ANZ62832.1 hypothetical protein AYR62_01095 [Secundilactobacillus paracollinoides]